MSDVDAEKLLIQSEREASRKLDVFLSSNRRSAWEERTRELRPREGDFQGVFVEGAAEEAEKIYLTLWNGELPLPAPWPGQTEIEVTACFAEQLREEHPRSQAFPPGYQTIASLMKPGTIWLSWKYTRPGSKCGARYDGLVKVGDRWVWLLRANRVLNKLVEEK